MEQQIRSKQANVDEMESIDLQPDPNPKDVPKLDPNPDGGVAKTVDRVDFKSSHGNSIELESKEKNGEEEENHVESSPDGLKTKKSVRWSQELVTETTVPRDADRGTSNPYVNYTASPNSNLNSNSNPSSFNLKETMGSMKTVLGKWGKKAAEATRKAEDFAENTWQHLKTSPSLADAALGRIAQGTKVLAEGGYDKIFQQTFETLPEEKLKNSFACYLSTSSGPVMGILYISTGKLAFCSDNPLSYEAGDKTEWSYYKVVMPLHQLKAVNPSTSRTNSVEKYIQVISIDNHEFWFMGFLKYDRAVECLQQALIARDTQSV